MKVPRNRNIKKNAARRNLRVHFVVNLGTLAMSCIVLILLGLAWLGLAWPRLAWPCLAWPLGLSVLLLAFPFIFLHFCRRDLKRCVTTVSHICMQSRCGVTTVSHICNRFRFSLAWFGLAWQLTDLKCTGILRYPFFNRVLCLFNVFGPSPEHRLNLPST